MIDEDLFKLLSQLILVIFTSKFLIEPTFFFRLRGQSDYLHSEQQLDEDNIIIRGLLPGEIYEFKVVSVDGDYMTESDPEEVETYSVG